MGVEPKYVLDACALVAYVNNEPGANVVEDALTDVASGNASAMMHRLNLLEVYYGLYREYDKETADDLLELPNELNIRIESLISDEVFTEAGRLKATYKISLADAIALAESSVSGAALLTSDHHEFDAVEKSENITFKWIR